MITLCAWGNGIPWAPSPAAPLAGTDRSSRGASPHALSSCHLRSGVNGAETRRPHNPHRAQRPLRARSTKAGTKTPATREKPNHLVRPVIRSTKAGAETPATHTSWALRYRTESSLNEGRGRDPGDTRWVPAVHEPARLRSTKAGAETPATQPHVGRPGTGQLRSTKAGAETPATPETVLDPADLRARSTKAGAETPATPPLRPRCPGGCNPLNEGRGRDPGDTRCSDKILQALKRAQRRPGPRPRRHPYRWHYARIPLQRSTKAGAETPATPHHFHEAERFARRSTKRNSVPDLPTPDSDFDHLFGLCLGMDVVTDPQMSSKSATNHNFEPSGA